jgi:hypothetical protein
MRILSIRRKGVHSSSRFFEKLASRMPTATVFPDGVGVTIGKVANANCLNEGFTLKLTVDDFATVRTSKFSADQNFSIRSLQAGPGPLAVGGVAFSPQCV